MVLKAWIPAYAGMTTMHCHPRLDRGSMPPTAMDTRLRGYDSHLVMPDSIGHPFLHCHPRLDREAMPSAAVDTRVRGYDKR